MRKLVMQGGMRFLMQMALRCSRVVATVGAMATLGAYAQVSIPGQFNVNESGAATYSIPIEVAPGVTGLAPKLTLNYNSQGPNGALGIGWSLGGLSSITRCPRTIAQDGVRGAVKYDFNDRYCIDGQRLVLVGGIYGGASSEYRTEIEGFSRIVGYGAAGNGPEFFIVQTKSGLTMEYGRSDDSRIEAQGTPTPAVWALNRIYDVNGNAMIIYYDEDGANGYAYPRSIVYGYNEVVFDYENRVDPILLYQAGSKNRILRRLKTVSNFSGGVSSFRYDLAYLQDQMYSKLESIQLCESSGACLPATTFGWLPEGKGFNGQYSGNVTLYSPNSQGALALGDFNGSGLTSFAKNLGNGRWGVCTLKFFYSFCIDPLAYDGGDANYRIGDFNGDGLADIASSMELGTGIWSVCLSTLAGSVFGNFDCHTVSAYLGNYLGAVVGDFDGDGRSDLAGSMRGTLWQFCYSRGTEFECKQMDAVWTDAAHVYAGDFDGNGTTDLAHHVSGNQWNVCLTQGTNISCSVWTGHAANPEETMTGDFNGDGKLDIAGFTGSGAIWHVCLSTGAGFDCIYTDITPHNALKNTLGDFNGDGRTDVASPGANGLWQVYFFNGSQFVHSADWPGPAAPAEKTLVGDFNGDGMTDLAAWTGSLGNWHVALSAAQMPLITSINVPAGQRINSIQYRALDSVYGPYTRDIGPDAARYPIQDLVGSMRVVTEIQVDDGIGGSAQTTYKYGGLKIDIGTGRGLQGFRWTSAIEADTGIESRNYFEQAWPCTGQVKVAETWRAGSGFAGLLKRITNTCASTEGTHAASRFVYTGQSVEVSWDLGGAAFPWIGTLTTYGQSPQWGDPTQVQVQYQDGAGKTTVNEYYPADTGAGRWVLGRLRRSTVTSVAP